MRRFENWFRLMIGMLLIGAATGMTVAADHRVEILDEPAPEEEVAAEIAKMLQPTGVRVIRGSTRGICDIWLCKQWTLKSFEAQGDVNYPFTPGQLIGVIRYPRRGSDFRDQDIDSGVYTLRYAQQPIDGAHVGTSPTRDFLLLIEAADDKTAAMLEYKPLTEHSAEAAKSSHPCLLSMQRTEGDEKDKPSIRNNQEHDWWIVRLQSDGVVEGQEKPVPFDLVVVGQAAE